MCTLTLDLRFLGNVVYKSERKKKTGFAVVICNSEITRFFYLQLVKLQDFCMLKCSDDLLV